MAEFAALAPVTAYWLALGLTAAGIAAAIWLRPPLPLDETRALTVGWEMWAGGNPLVPHLNGLPYDHKPPLLYWSMHLVWALAGVSEWAARLVGPLYSLAALALTAPLARRLWPERREAAGLASLMLASTAWFVITSTLVMFDGALACATMVGMLGLAEAWRGRMRAGWLLYGLGIGLGVLAKGPVILVHLLPAGLLAPLWQGRAGGGHWRRWYGGLLFGLALGAAIGLAWALPAAAAGGEPYAAAILWGQSAGRIVHSFAHARPWWAYLPMLPAVLFPWLWWPPLWRAARRLPGTMDPGLRLCLVWMGAGLLLLSSFSAKQPHYLVPLLPAAALFGARLLAAEKAAGPRWAAVLPALPLAAAGSAGIVLTLVGDKAPLPAAIAALAAWLWPALLGLAGAYVLFARRALVVATVLLVPALIIAVELAGQRTFALYDLRAVAAQVRAAAPEGIASFGGYRGEFGFLARLTGPVDRVDTPAAAREWLAAHPNGIIVDFYNPKRPDLDWAPAYVQPYRGDAVGIWRRPAAP